MNTENKPNDIHSESIPMPATEPEKAAQEQEAKRVREVAEVSAEEPAAKKTDDSTEPAHEKPDTTAETIADAPVLPEASALKDSTDLQEPVSPATADAAMSSASSAASPATAPTIHAREASTSGAGKSNATASNTSGKSKKTSAKPKGPAPSTLVEPGMAERSFNSLSWLGLPVLLALTALMCVAEIATVRTLWFSDEVRHADVYMRLLGGDWLALSLNGLPYPDKPPLYFWFLQWLDIGGGILVEPPLLFFLGTALSAVFFVGATWLLARATGHDRRESFAAGLLVIGCLFFAGLAHYPRMDLLFAAVIVLSLVCLYRGWIKASAPLWLTAGFVLAGVAALIKGPLALAFPILSSILFLILRGTPGRLNGRDGILGFALMLLMIMGWATALYFAGHADYLREIIGPQIAGRMVNAWHHAAPWWYYLAALPLVCLPWIFLALFVNWWAAAKSLPEAWKTRRENGGRMWLWIVFLSGFALLSAVSGKIAIYLLPVLPALAIVAAHALLKLTPTRSRWFFLSVGIFLTVLGLALALVQVAPHLLPYLPETWTTRLPAIARAYMENTGGLILMGLVAMVFGIALLRFSRRSLPGGALLLSTFGIICLMQPYALVVAPSLDTMLSPRAQAEAMAKQVQEGFFPAAYRVYPGIYSYYMNEEMLRSGLAADSDPNAARDSAGLIAAWPSATVRDLPDDDALRALLREQPRVVIAMREKDWLKGGAWDANVVHRQWIVDQPYVLITLDQTVSLPQGTPVSPIAPPPPLNTPVAPLEGADIPQEIQPERSPEPADSMAETPPASVENSETGTVVETPAPAETPVPADTPAEVPASAPASVVEEPTFL